MGLAIRGCIQRVSQGAPRTRIRTSRFYKKKKKPLASHEISCLLANDVGELLTVAWDLLGHCLGCLWISGDVCACSKLGVRYKLQALMFCPLVHSSRSTLPNLWMASHIVRSYVGSHSLICQSVAQPELLQQILRAGGGPTIRPSTPTLCVGTTMTTSQLRGGLPQIHAVLHG